MAAASETNEVAFEESFDLFSSFDGSHRDVFISRKSRTYQLKIGDGTIRLKQDAQLLGGKGVTGAAVWDSAVVLAKFCEINRHLVKDKKIIEIGAGCGLTGLAAERLGCKSIVLTDQDHMIPLLKDNAEENSLGNVSVKELVWSSQLSSDFDAPYDVIIAADCVFNEAINEDLVAVLCALTDDTSIILLSSELRCSHVFENFLARSIEHFALYRIPSSECHPDFKCESVVMYAMRKCREGEKGLITDTRWF